MNQCIKSLAYCGLQFAGCFFGAFLSCSDAVAQPAAARIKTENEPLTITKDWDKEGREEFRQFDAMYRGERPVATDEDRSILDNGARWYAYRLTQLLYQEGTSGKSMHDLVKQAVSKIVDPRDTRRPPNTNQLAFKEEYDRRLIGRLGEVLKTSKPIARVNAAMILAEIAKTGQEAAIDALLEIVQDPQENDGVKLYALRGLMKFFESGQGETPFKSTDHEAKCVQVLIDYVQHKPDAKQALTPSESAALSYVRSEAVSALGLTRYPAVSTTMKKVVIIERMTAFPLLRIISKDGMAPEPTLAEQVNAVVALSQLQARRCDEYQMDYAAYHVGRFVNEFLKTYNADTVKLDWKVLAARLHLALEDLKTQAERGSAKTYVAKLATDLQTRLNEVIVGKNKPDTQNLGAYLENNPPASKSLFKNRADTAIKEVEKAAEQ